MASYTNLASLAGLAVGDIVTYNTTTTIDFKKYKVRIKLNGLGYNSNYAGGLTQFDLDTKILPSQSLTYSPLYGTSLSYGSAASVWRIAVAGNIGGRADGNSVSSPAKGGGNTGQNAGSQNSSDDLNSVAYGGKGGSQTAGGNGGTCSMHKVNSYYSLSNYTGKNGDFGRNPASSVSGGIDRFDYYMAGWYSGGQGGYGYATSSMSYMPSYSAIGLNGGGSGFVIGQSTTTYPSGYLGDNTTLQSTIASAISNATLTQGGSTAYYTSDANLPTTAFMTVEILAVPAADYPKYYYNNAWHDTEWKYYSNGWHDIEIKRYNGSSWQ